MAYTPTKWVNNSTPPIDEDNLNKIEEALLSQNNSVTQINKTLDNAGLNDPSSAQALQIVPSLNDTFTDSSGTTSDIVDSNDKIYLNKLVELLEQLTVNNGVVSYGGSELPSGENYGNYIFNAYYNGNTGDFSDGQTCDYFHITLKRSSGTWTSVTVAYDGGNSFTIGHSGSTVDFFDSSDTFDFVNIELKRIKTVDGASPHAVVTVSGCDALGYNFRQVEKIIQIGAITKINPSCVGATLSSTEILYALPGSAGIQSQQLYSNFATQDFTAVNDNG